MPLSYYLRLPQDGERPNHPPSNSSGVNTLAFWNTHLEAGLRFSIPKYLCEISNLFQVPLNQFVPNEIRAMISLFMLIKGNGGEPTAKMFFFEYVCKSVCPLFYVCGRFPNECKFLGKVSNVNKDSGIIGFL